MLIEALGQVRTSRDIELRVAGVVENERYWLHCQELQRLAIAANPRLRISNLGQLDYPDTDELLRRSDIVAVPSQWPEPLGAVAIEAMAAGAAVVASDIGGLGSYPVDGRTGLLVDPYDVARWTGAIESLLRRPRWARMLGTAASRRARSLTAEAHIDALDRLIGTLPSRGPEALPAGAAPREGDPQPAGIDWMASTAATTPAMPIRYQPKMASPRRFR